MQHYVDRHIKGRANSSKKELTKKGKAFRPRLLVRRCVQGVWAWKVQGQSPKGSEARLVFVISCIEYGFEARGSDAGPDGNQLTVLFQLPWR